MFFRTKKHAAEAVWYTNLKNPIIGTDHTLQSANAILNCSALSEGILCFTCFMVEGLLEGMRPRARQ